MIQVHRATMKNGNVVAVKVQHKFVKKHSFVDIYTMDFLVRSVKFFFPQFEFMWLAEEMKKNMPLELAFTQEAKNAEKVAKIMREAFITVHSVQLPSLLSLTVCRVSSSVVDLDP
jgi:aarF domain-containing kinase